MLCSLERATTKYNQWTYETSNNEVLVFKTHSIRIICMCGCNNKNNENISIETALLPNSKENMEKKMWKLDEIQLAMFETFPLNLSACGKRRI